MSLTGILLGIINILIVIAIFVLIGYIIVWIMNIFGFPIPAVVQKLFMTIVALIALYMLVALLIGGPQPWRLIHGSIYAPPSIMVER